ncbi:MAG: TPM domain-containing protein, partial [Gemmatimonadota bacterium]|nr:TPM domain-containing protein [Gemmatimonadota bacterium]
MPYSLALRSAVLAVVALLQGGPQIPAPQGLVNDFAQVLTPASAARIEQIAQDVRDKTKGEIAVVTLADIGDRDKADVAREIGRQWKVGNLADIGDKSRNAGVVILVVPKETAADKAGRCRIEVGQGAEGYLTDATAGEICREATPLFQQKDYSGALELITLRVAQRFAQEFNVALDTAFQAPVVRQPAAQGRSRGSFGLSPFALLVILFVV